MAGLKDGSLPVHSLKMALGDVMIRDVRAIHRGTPNHTETPRPMVVLGYSRRWLHRPEVHIRVPREAWSTLSPIGKQLLRNNPIVDEANLREESESYRAFAY